MHGEGLPGLSIPPARIPPACASRFPCLSHEGAVSAGGDLPSPPASRARDLSRIAVGFPSLSIMQVLKPRRRERDGAADPHGAAPGSHRASHVPPVCLSVSPAAPQVHI